MKKITPKLKKEVEKAVKNLLHASRDCMRNQGKDTINLAFSVNDGWYGEAFGVMRGLQILKYGAFKSSNLNGLEERLDQEEQNLMWWFKKLEDEVLDEEGFKTDHVCEHCREKYYKDDASLLEQGKLSLE